MQDVRDNIFPPARAAIADWGAFHWHPHASSPKSSQALAIDVFGTIQTAPARDAILAALARELGLSDQGPWSLHLEWQDQSNGLAEPRPTQVDAFAEGSTAMMLFECKFTEAGGACSQINPDRRGVVACTGAYRLQTNPQNDKEARCALTGKGHEVLLIRRIRELLYQQGFTINGARHRLEELDIQGEIRVAPAVEALDLDEDEPITHESAANPAQAVAPAFDWKALRADLQGVIDLLRPALHS